MDPWTVDEARAWWTRVRQASGELAKSEVLSGVPG